MQTKKRLMSLALSGILLVFPCIPSVYADSVADVGITDMSGLCEHHTGHTPDCGYTEGAPETPCTHEHIPDCYTEVNECVHEHVAECYPEAEDIVSDAQEQEPESCTHVCSEENGCITTKLTCLHEHDSDCGYTEEVPETPCTFVCEICNPQDIGDAQPPVPANGGQAGIAQAKIDALPEAYILLINGGAQEIVTETDEDVLGDGCIEYDADKNIITLKSCNSPDMQIIYNYGEGRTLGIELVGENFLKTIGAECDCLNITGEGSLKVERNDNGYNISASNNLFIGADVTAISTHPYSFGIVAEGELKISGSTVTVESVNDALQGYQDVVIENSTIKATSTESNGINSLHGDIIINQNSNVIATSDGSDHGCGILATSGQIIVEQSNVTASASVYPGLQGNGGVAITNCQRVEAASVNDCGIYSPETVEISGSVVTASSQKAAGIFTRYVLEIEHSGITAQGFYPGLNGQGGISITNNSDVTATSSNDYGIYTPGDLTVKDSEVYADGSPLGIRIGNSGNVSGSWIRAENNIETGNGNPDNYMSMNSVTIQSGVWGIVGDAKVPDGALIKKTDVISIPQNASLSIGEEGTKILGEVDGITVEDDEALRLPAGTEIVNADGTHRTIGEGGGKITLEGDVFDSSVYSVTVENDGNGTASASPDSAAEGTEITLTAAPNSGYRFKEWQVISGGVRIANNSFTMSAENVIVKAVFEENNGGSSSGSGDSSGSSSGGGNSSGSGYFYDDDDNDDSSDDSSTSSRGSSSSTTTVYGRKKLTDSGLTLSGDRVHRSARLSVTKDRLHRSGDCAYCDQIRQWQKQDRVIAVYDVALDHGFRGTVTLTFPVPSKYNGKKLTIVHCLGDKLDSFDVTASKGMVTVTVDSLSPFAILESGVEDEGENPNTGAC